VLREEDALFNAVMLFGARGERLAVYRKRHPWFPETWATAGAERPPVVSVCGARVTIALCFDVHFLAEDAAPELEAADVLLFPSAWVDEEDSRTAILAELARRFGVHVASANWGAGVVRVAGQGGSCILGTRGEVLARVERGGLRADAMIPA
jgi:predicted amidohydrolase